MHKTTRRYIQETVLFTVIALRTSDTDITLLGWSNQEGRQQVFSTHQKGGNYI